MLVNLIDISAYEYINKHAELTQQETALQKMHALILSHIQMQSIKDNSADLNLMILKTSLKTEFSHPRGGKRASI